LGYENIESETTDCIFCRIAAGTVPTETIYQDEDVIAFRDINPQAPVHLLIIPRKHIPSLAELSDEDSHIIARMTMVANHIARSEGILESGYRVAVNCGEWGGQLVPHLHMHLIGGRELSGKLG
jgi:histidine triad (HIT) family protein